MDRLTAFCRGTMSKDLIGYEEIIQDAMRGVVREALRRVRDGGLPPSHQLYLTFQTDREDVSLPDSVRAANPNEITIVLQNQFWDLKVEERSFSVTLNFNKLPAEVVVPYDALLGFADSGANFGLQFRSDGDGAAPQETAAAGTEGETADLGAVKATDDDDADAEPGANVVQIDRFRRK